MNKKEIIEKLNSIEIVEHSISCGELDYILAENTLENAAILTELGADIADMITDEDNETLDITNFAFYNLQIDYWNPATGFRYETESEIYLEVLESIKAGSENVIAAAEDKHLFAQAITAAIEAYKKINIPLKPNTKESKCPRCKHLVTSDKFCRNCGQALDWNDKPPDIECNGYCQQCNYQSPCEAIRQIIIPNGRDSKEPIWAKFSTSGIIK